MKKAVSKKNGAGNVEVINGESHHTIRVVDSGIKPRVPANTKRTKAVKAAKAAKLEGMATAKGNGNGKAEKKPARASKSGKYRSIRHLVETLLHKDKEADYGTMEKAIKAEYPGSKFQKTHYFWYRAHILGKKEWNHVA